MVGRKQKRESAEDLMNLNKRLGTKICGGFGALVLVAILLGTMAVWNMNRVGR